MRPAELNRIPVHEATARYVELIRARTLTGGLSPSTAEVYARDMATLTDLAGPDQILDDLTGEDVDAVLLAFARKPDGRRATPVPGGQSPSSQARFRRSVSALFKHAVLAGWVQVNPMSTATVTARERGGLRPQRRALTKEQAHGLIGAARDLAARDLAGDRDLAGARGGAGIDGAGIDGAGNGRADRAGTTGGRAGRDEAGHDTAGRDRAHHDTAHDTAHHDGGGHDGDVSGGDGSGGSGPARAGRRPARRDQRTEVRDALIVLLLAGVGPRVSELVRADVEHFFVNDGVRYWRIFGKGGRTRDVPLPRDVASALDAYLAVRPRPAAGAEKALLLSWRGRRLARGDVQAVIDRVLARVSPDHRRSVTPHGLRHTTATHLLANAVDMDAVRRVLGHSDLSTLGRYRDELPGELEVAMRAHPLLRPDIRPDTPRHHSPP